MIHVAGEIDGDRRQRCARCHVVLKDLTLADRFDGETHLDGGVAYPVGAKVEKHNTWQAMVVGQSAADCEPVE